VWAVWHLGKDRFPSKELRERLRTDDITLVLQQNRLQWYRHVLRNEYDDWVKIAWSMKHEAEGSRPTGKPNRTGWGKGLSSTQIEHGGCYGSQ